MKFHTEDPEMLGATVQNLVARATWCTGFVHLYIYVFFNNAEWSTLYSVER